MDAQSPEKVNSNDLKVVAVRIPPKMHKRLKGIALKKERTVEELYQEALQMYLEAQ